NRAGPSQGPTTAERPPARAPGPPQTQEDLNLATKTEIESMLAREDGLMKERNFVAALVDLEAALARLPEPADRFPIATRIFSQIGESYFQLGDFKQAAKNMSTALECPDGIGDPFVLLRCGQASFEIGDIAEARRHLNSALLGGGEALFASEDPKYLAL